MRRLLLVLLSCTIVLSACGPSKSWPGGADKAPSQLPSAAATTLAPTETPTEAPTKKPTKTPTAAPTAAGNAFSPPDGSFAVLMPGKPTLETSTMHTTLGDAPRSLWTYEVSNDLAYFVGEAKYPKGSLSALSTSSTLDAILNMLVSGAKGTLSAKSDTTLGGHPGRTFTIDASEASLKGALYVVNDDLYMVFGGYTSAITDMTDIDAFLASFTFTI